MKKAKNTRNGLGRYFSGLSRAPTWKTPFKPLFNWRRARSSCSLLSSCSFFRFFVFFRFPSQFTVLFRFFRLSSSILPLFRFWVEFGQSFFFLSTFGSEFLFFVSYFRFFPRKIVFQRWSRLSFVEDVMACNAHNTHSTPFATRTTHSTPKLGATSSSMSSIYRSSPAKRSKPGGGTPRSGGASSGGGGGGGGGGGSWTMVGGEPQKGNPLWPCPTEKPCRGCTRYPLQNQEH